MLCVRPRRPAQRANRHCCHQRGQSPPFAAFILRAATHRLSSRYELTLGSQWAAGLVCVTGVSTERLNPGLKNSSKSSLRTYRRPPRRFEAKRRPFTPWVIQRHTEDL